jgi:putative Mn2+ efflux pump MntP
MSIASYIVIALALGLVNMVLFRRCGEAMPVRLSAGLLIVLGVSAVHAVLYYLGAALGNLMRLDSASDSHMYDDVNAYIFLGIVLVVIIKMLVPYLRREPRLPVFSLARTGSVLAMAVATGINVLLVGIGVGFADSEVAVHALLWPLLVAGFLLGYMGLMFGRRKVDMRPRRWMVLASVLLLATAIAACVNAG